jgi:hypothetical protein
MLRENALFLSLTSKLSKIVQRVLTLLTNSASIQTLLTQFQTRYPSGGVTSELLTIHEQNFVVRAVIQVGNTTLATAMAAAIDIEQAEDRAKIRALTALGIGAFAGNIPSPSLAYSFAAPASVETPTPSPPSEAPTSSSAIASKAVPTLPSTTPAPEYQAVGSTPVVAPTASYQPELVDHSDAEMEGGLEDSSIMPSVTPLKPSSSFEPSSFEPSEPSLLRPLPEQETYLSTAPSMAEDFDLPTPDLPTEPESLSSIETTSSTETTKPSKPSSSKGKSSKRKTEPPEEPASPANEQQRQEVVDRSDVNAKIGVEMKRLGWTVDQGRNYLKRTYGKRSRQELEDVELLDFLDYLEAQPMPANSPF